MFEELIAAAMRHGAEIIELDFIEGIVRDACMKNLVSGL